MTQLKYIRVLPASKTVRHNRVTRAWHGVGLLAALAGFMLAAYTVAYTVCMVNGASLG